MSGYVFKEAAIVRNQIEALKAIYPEISEDIDLLADTIEGQTNLDAILEKLVGFVLDAESMAEAVKARKAEISERQKRFERQSETGRKAIHQLMEAACQSKIVLPEATLSILPGRQNVAIFDLDSLPQGTFKTERIPDKAAIKSLISAGEDIPGAELRTSADTLSVRTR